MYLDGQIADHRQMETPSSVPPRDDGSRPVRVRVGEGSDLSLEAGEPGTAALFHPQEEVLEGVVEPSERLLGHMSIDSTDTFFVVAAPSSEVSALVHVGPGLLRLPPRIDALFEGVIPQEPQFLELPKEFSLLTRKWIEAVLERLMHLRR